MIRCRARVSAHCSHGRNEQDVGPEYEMADDGTWNGHTVICDACFIYLMPLTPSGQGELHELEMAIAEARDIQRPLNERAARFVAEATRAGMVAKVVVEDDGIVCRAYRGFELEWHFLLRKGERAIIRKEG